MEWTNAQGYKAQTEFTADYDGKDYPVKGSRDFNVVALRRIGANTLLLVSKKDGNVVRMNTIVVWKDGKALNQVELGVDSSGQIFHLITVFDKQ